MLGTWDLLRMTFRSWFPMDCLNLWGIRQQGIESFCFCLPQQTTAGCLQAEGSHRIARVEPIKG